jgi:hypothetical protein
MPCSAAVGYHCFGGLCYPDFTLKMEVARSFKMLVTYHNPEYLNLIFTTTKTSTLLEVFICLEY